MAEEIIEVKEIQTGDARTKEYIILTGSRRALGGFLDFIRDRGVAGFAIGFILGGAAQKLVQALMDDIINPLVGLFLGLGPTHTLTEYAVGSFKVGDFISALTNFFILCIVVYVVFKLLRLEKLDKPKS